MYMINKRTGKCIFSSKDGIIRDSSENFRPTGLFPRQLNLEVEKLPKGPTEGQINKVLKSITCKNSHAYMLYPKWYTDKDVAEIDDYLASIKERNAISQQYTKNEIKGNRKMAEVKFGSKERSEKLNSMIQFSEKFTFYYNERDSIIWVALPETKGGLENIRWNMIKPSVLRLRPKDSTAIVAVREIQDSQEYYKVVKNLKDTWCKQS